MKNITKNITLTKALFLNFLVILFLVFSCNKKDDEKQNTKIYSGKPKIEFYTTAHDFGTITEGEIVECTFRFKNTGEAPLKLIYVDADCGCTVPKYNKEKINPGEEGKITAVFNSEGFRNNIYKTIDVETNADSTITELKITAFIKSNFNLE